MRRPLLALALALVLVPLAPVMAQPADTPWPMVQHDARRTGKSTASGPSSGAVKVKWTFKGKDWIKTQPAIGGDGTVYVGNHSSPSIGLDGTIYVGTSQGLFAVRDDGASGAVLPGWSFTDNGAPGEFDTAAAISDGTLFASRFYQGKRTLYAVAATDAPTGSPGALRWKKGPAAGSTSSKNSQTPSPVVGANGIVYAAIGLWVYAFDPGRPTPATPLWQHKLPKHAISLAVGDGVLYVAARDSNLYAIVDQ